jgi:hypothetical protein
MARIENLIGLVADKSPTEFFEAYSNILGERAIEAVKARRQEIAESLFGEEIADAEEVVAEEENNDSEDASDENA